VIFEQEDAVFERSIFFFGDGASSQEYEPVAAAAGASHGLLHS